MKERKSDIDNLRRAMILLGGLDEKVLEKILGEQGRRRDVRPHGPSSELMSGSTQELDDVGSVHVRST